MARKGGFIGHDGLNAPDAVTGVTGAAGDEQVSVSFDAPSDEGGAPITGYVATSNDGIGNTGSSSPITVTGLTNDVAYTFKVWAINAFGYSAPSDASGSVTPVQAPIGIFAGGTGPYNTIDQVIITTTGSRTDFGDLVQATSEMAGCSSSTRGIFGGGNSTVQENTIQYITMRSAGNATDFGDLTNGARSLMTNNGASNETRGLLMGGANASFNPVNFIDYITIATTSNSTDFGDLAQGVRDAGAAASPTRAILGGGEGPTDQIQYITIATTGNALDFGDLTVIRSAVAATSSSTRAVFCGGIDGGTRYNTIDYITIASTGNATDFGDLNQQIFQGTATSDSISALFAGGRNASNVNQSAIRKFTIATTGNTTDFGSLVGTRRNLSSCSTSHGGLT